MDEPLLLTTANDALICSLGGYVPPSLDPGAGIHIAPPAFDPEGASVFGSVHNFADGDPDIHLFFEPDGLPAINDDIFCALQTHSDVLLQKSTRE